MSHTSLPITVKGYHSATLTELVKGLGEASSKHDEKSLRLHKKPFENGELKVSTRWSRPQLKSGRQQTRSRALNLVTHAMMREHKIDGDTANQILRKIGVTNKKISLGQLKTLGKVMEVERFKKLTIGQLTKLENGLAPTGHGGTGALMVKDPSLPYGGVVVKFESEENLQSALGTSEYILNISEKLGERGVRLPFDAMVVDEAPIDIEALENIKHGLNSQRTEENGTRVDRCLDKLSQVGKGLVPMKGMFLEGHRDISSLPVEDRLSLVRGNDFPRALGGVMVMSRLVGIGDHVSLGLSKHQGGSLTNLSNLMINPTTGRVAIIDYASVSGGRKPSDDKVVPGYGSDHVKDAFKTLKEIAEYLSNKPQDGVNLHGERRDIEITSYRDILYSAYDSGTLFIKDEDKKIDETHHLKSLKPAEKNKFIINTIIGALDAWKLISENPEAFLSGTPMFDEPETVIPHLQELAKGIDEIRDKLVNYVSK